MARDSGEDKWVSKLIGVVKGKPEGVEAKDNETLLTLEQTVNDITEDMNRLWTQLLETKRSFLQRKKTNQELQEFLEKTTHAYLAKKYTLNAKFSAATSLLNRHPGNGRIQAVISVCQEKLDLSKR